MANWREMFSGPIRYTPVEPPTNQVYSNEFSPANPYAQRDFPDQAMVVSHRLAFERRMGVQEVDPPYWMGLPPGRYEGRGASDHPSKRPIWRLSEGGETVADVPALLSVLAGVTGDESGSDLIAGQVYHSHWVGLKGGAVSQLLIVNQGMGTAGDARAGEGGRAILLDAEEIGAMLALPSDDLKRVEWFKLNRQLLTQPL